MKTKEGCIHYISKKDEGHLNQCKLLHDTVECKPESCNWYLTDYARLQSLVKAVESWQRNHPGENWEQHRTLVPKQFHEVVKKMLKMKKYVEK